MDADAGATAGRDGEELGGSSTSPGPDAPGAGAARAQSPGWFADGGPADHLAPGAGLAAAVADAIGSDGSGLGGLGDEDLLGVIAATHRLTSWLTWVQLLGLGQFAARRPGTNEQRYSRDAAEEVSWKTGETWHRIGEQMMRSRTCQARLPETFRALGKGLITGYKLDIIEAQTAELTEQDAAKADVILAAAAQVKSPAALRDFARRQVARIDPDAAQRRKTRARRDGHVRFWKEDSGNAGMTAREMPAGPALIAWQHVEQRALDLRAAGHEGNLGELQVQAVLDLLAGNPIPATQTGRVPECAPAADECVSSYAPADDGGAGAYQGTRKGGRRWAAEPVLIVPWDPSLGVPAGPASVPGFGEIDDPVETMDLLGAAANHRTTRWCVTVTGSDGTALAHGCAAGRHTLDTICATGTSKDLITRLGITLTPLAVGMCGHDTLEPGYTPSPRLRHLVTARNPRCSAPGCGKPAAACDLDHTLAWDQGGLTCECGLAALCRFHHQVKQAEGWRLHQPAPGLLVWNSPTGLTRTTTPVSYYAD
jgi:Domain of unknown function (DUF222)